jgi:hypothetical protein
MTSLLLTLKSAFRECNHPGGFLDSHLERFCDVVGISRG